MDIQAVEKNVDLFEQMLRCNSPIDLWRFNGDGKLLGTNCAYADPYLRVMEVFSCRDTMLACGQEDGAPLWLSTPMGLCWLVVFYREEGVLLRIYAVGPILAAETPFRAIRETINANQGLNSGEQLEQLVAALEAVPVVPLLVSNQLTLMLHQAVTGEAMKISDIRMPCAPTRLGTGKTSTRDRHRVWMAEQNLLRMVQEGDLNYRDALSAAGTLSQGVGINTGNALRQAKDSVIVSISLCVRAAIRGGLSPDTAYSLGDSYIQSVEQAQALSDVGGINGIMYEDFVRRVHQSRTNPDVSANIRRCCDYIETHTEEELGIEELAKMLGYTEYYLSRKFREEMQVGLNDYIKIARVERAKFLLTGTDESVQGIADRLKFCSVSHFGATFRKIAGCSPKEYRERMSKSDTTL